LIWRKINSGNAAKGVTAISTAVIHSFDEIQLGRTGRRMGLRINFNLDGNVFSSSRGKKSVKTLFIFTGGCTIFCHFSSPTCDIFVKFAAIVISKVHITTHLGQIQ
jgi:hypothetical protein